MFIGSEKKNKGVVIISKEDYDKILALAENVYFRDNSGAIKQKLGYLYENINIDELIAKEKNNSGGDYSSIEFWQESIGDDLDINITNNSEAMIELLQRLNRLT